MPRRWIVRKAMVVILLMGATLPAALAAVLLFGCCALPFHALLHRVAPLCQMAARMVAGSHEHGGTEHRQPAEPARPREDDSTRTQVQTRALPRAESLVAATVTPTIFSGGSPVAWRSWLGRAAFRCDEDVGARLSLLATLRV